MFNKSIFFVFLFGLVAFAGCTSSNQVVSQFPTTLDVNCINCAGNGTSTTIVSQQIVYDVNDQIDYIRQTDTLNNTIIYNFTYNVDGLITNIVRQ